MSKIFLSYLLTPLSLSLILFGISAWLLWHKRKAGKAVLIAAVVFFLLISTPFLPNALVRHLEGQYPHQEVTRPHFTSIMVLGAGYSDDPEIAATKQLNTTTLTRLVEAVRIYHSTPGSRVILSAGTTNQPRTQAEVAALAALELGVAPSDTLMLTTALNTIEEARSFKARFGTVPVIVVTSALHMPRAMMIFHRLGIPAIPAPTDHLLKKDHGTSWINYLPRTSSLRKMELVMHEYLGMLWLSVVL